MNSPCRQTFFRGLLLGLVLCAAAVTSYAQNAGPAGWDEPINLSNSPAQSEAPAIVADPSGMVHVFWGENTNESLNYANTIFYTRWDGQAWSQPHDILISPEGLRAMAGKPSAVVSSDGRIDLAWAGGNNGTIYFSSARADEAISAQAWRRPLPVGKTEAGADEPRLALEVNGKLDLTFVVSMGGEQGIYHASSEDGGQSWSAPTAITGSRQGGNRILFAPRLAAGADGALHVTWYWANLPETFPPQGVFYSRSTDGGKTWSEPLAVATGPYGSSEVAAIGQQEVHLVWCGTLTDRHKFHQWSQDGGQTWSRPTTILEIGGFQGYGGMAVDGAGRLQMALIGSHPEFGDVVYHLQWDGQNWGPPQAVLRITQAVGQNPRNAAIAIANGNEAHIVAEIPQPSTGLQLWQMDILHSSARLAAPHAASQPLPTVTPAPTGTATPTAAPRQPATAVPGEPGGAGASATPAGPARFPVERSADPAGGGAGALTAGMVAVVLALGLVIVLQVARRGGNGMRG